MKHKGKKANRGLKFGGLSFQPDHTPFASVTGKDEMPMDDDLISEPPWWLVAAGGSLLGQLRLFKKCNCQNEDGSTTQLDDCPRLQSCEKCCLSRQGENFVGGFDPMTPSQTRG